MEEVEELQLPVSEGAGIQLTLRLAQGKPFDAPLMGLFRASGRNGRNGRNGRCRGHGRGGRENIGVNGLRTIMNDYERHLRAFEEGSDGRN